MSNKFEPLLRKVLEENYDVDSSYHVSPELRDEIEETLNPVQQDSAEDILSKVTFDERADYWLPMWIDYMADRKFRKCRTVVDYSLFQWHPLWEYIMTLDEFIVFEIEKHAEEESPYYLTHHPHIPFSRQVHLMQQVKSQNGLPGSIV